ncbi:hypothetical protein ACH437_28150 [Streptomyces xinghaiensis]|uniref:hypothetical protein n=1 Tax=Streptomyces xinghaiensis TaxID=1038928 RepID=UPI00379B7005
MYRERAHIEQVFADLEDSALAHLPSGKFTANAARLTRAASHLASVFHARARTGTIHRHLINIPTRIATDARRITLHLPNSGAGPTTSPTCGQQPASACSPEPPDRPAHPRPERPRTGRPPGHHHAHTTKEDPEPTQYLRSEFALWIEDEISTEPGTVHSSSTRTGNDHR